MLDFNIFITDTHAIILLTIAFVAFVCLGLYYGLYHMRVGLYKRKAGQGSDPQAGSLPPVSVVLTAHNDAEWLKENLVYLLEQDYPDFEVVVVDYLSQDDTASVLKLLKEYYPHLKVVPFVGNISVREGVASHEDVNLFQGKKYPLSIGIKSAKNDILMLADPECTPKNLLWLRGMVKGYTEPKTKIVLGYCGVKRKKTLLGALQQYDSLAYGAHYLGSALMGHPYTGSGRNLSYRRSFFFKQGAFISHYDVADGSDDLFIYQNADRDNTNICIDNDACLTVEPKKTFAQWREYRLHRVATRRRHSIGSRAAEQMLPVANIAFYVAATLMAMHGTVALIAAVALGVLKWAWQIVCFSRLTRKFDGGYIHFAAPLLELYFIVANTFLILSPLHSNRKFRK